MQSRKIWSVHMNMIWAGMVDLSPYFTCSSSSLSLTLSPRIENDEKNSYIAGSGEKFVLCTATGAGALADPPLPTSLPPSPTLTPPLPPSPTLTPPLHPASPSPPAVSPGSPTLTPPLHPASPSPPAAPPPPASPGSPTLILPLHPASPSPPAASPPPASPGPKIDWGTDTGGVYARIEVPFPTFTPETSFGIPLQLPSGDKDFTIGVEVVKDEEGNKNGKISGKFPWSYFRASVLGLDALCESHQPSSSQPTPRVLKVDEVPPSPLLKTPFLGL